METILAVYIGDFNSMVPEYGSKGKKSQRLGPKIIRGKIMYPGIYQKNMWGVSFHGTD
jgi:hypothetical protein